MASHSPSNHSRVAPRAIPSRSRSARFRYRTRYAKVFLSQLCMNLFSRTALPLFRQGFVHGLDGFEAIFPLFISFGIEHDEARFALHSQYQGPMGFLEQAGEPGRLAFEGRQRMDVLGYVNHFYAPEKHLIKC